MLARALPNLLLLTILAGCASGPTRIEPRFKPNTPAEAAAAAECTGEIKLRRGELASFGQRTAAATATASKAIVREPLSGQSVGWFILTAPVALALGVTSAAVQGGLDRAVAQAAADDAFAACVRSRLPGSGPAVAASAGPVRDGKAELQALGVELP